MNDILDQVVEEGVSIANCPASTEYDVNWVELASHLSYRIFFRGVGAYTIGEVPGHWVWVRICIIVRFIHVSFVILEPPNAVGKASGVVLHNLRGVFFVICRRLI